jgi:hypothetical protein
MWKAAQLSFRQALRHFRDGQAGVVTSAVLAALLGLVFPLLMLPMLWLLGQFGVWSSWFVAPCLLVCFVSPIAAVYWRTAPGQYRWSLTVARQSFLVTVLFALTVACSTFCFADHVCMAGHMKHPPYATGEYLGDALWAGGMIVAVIGFTRIRSHASLAAAAVTGFLLSFRFGFGSLGGMFPFPL